MLEMRKLPRLSVPLHDRINKSDAEDKSLSNDETPLPTCPRQPPDGVETPSDILEKVPDPPTRLPPSFTSGWPKSRPRYSYTSRTQDARSEASVKDKIAMFSNDSITSSDRLDKLNCGTLPRNATTPRKSSNFYSSNYTDVSSLDRRLTKSQDNLDETPRSYKKHLDRPEALGSLENTSTAVSHNVSCNRTLSVDNKPLFYGSTTTLPSCVDKSYAPPIYHARSISDDNGNKKSSNAKSNLEYLIEQRKKSMSKLRGLVIPEAPVIDLPEIKIQDNYSKSFLFPTNQEKSTSKENKINNTKDAALHDTKWKSNLLPNNIPKYSPAFKRKSLQVYTPSCLSKESTPERKFNEKIDTLNRISYKPSIAGPLRCSYDTKVLSERLSTSTLPSKFAVTNASKISNKDYNHITDLRDFKNVEIKICTATDIVDSDNDSAMSSTQSSYRSSASSPMHNNDTVESDCSRLSPRISNYTSYSFVKEIPTKSSIIEKTCEEYVKRNVCRSVSSDTNVSLSSSAGSAATSGSQASCSSLESSVADSDKKKVSKSLNIDTINRRNILASAKCRSGRDAKLKSPVIESKFTHESYTRSPSPTPKSSDRLSTLTSSVSAVSNKGENRRRNKIIAETDSDSDNEINVRQRKTDFKNTRLKRNSSSSNKSKNDISLESTKVEDAPKVISEKIIKEIKKAGLDNFSINKATVETQKNILDIRKTETVQMKIDKSIRYTDVDVVDNKVSSHIVDKTEKLNNRKKNINRDSINAISVSSDEIVTHSIRLQRGSASGVGLILAGGIDCEAKDVTVHRVLADSIAAKAGLKRGSKVRSINGSVMAGLTHAQSVTILKEPRSEVIIEIENEINGNANGVGCGSEIESKVRQKVGEESANKGNDSGSVVSVSVEKAGGGAGLGFGLDGGRDSPNGDRPLTIKKLFAGGAAAQSGRVLVGAELLSAGGQSMEGFTRTQAWAALKALPAGAVILVLRNPKGKTDS